MKIVFPLEKKNSQKLADGFHGSHFLGLFNLATNERELHSISELEITFEKKNLMSIFSELGINIVICNKIHPMALNIFNDKKITVYKSEGDNVEANIDLLKKGRLNIYQTNMIQQSGCNSNCSSCNSVSCN